MGYGNTGSHKERQYLKTSTGEKLTYFLKHITEWVYKRIVSSITCKAGAKTDCSWKLFRWLFFAKFQITIFFQFLPAYFSTVHKNMGGLSCVKICFYRGLCSCCEVLGALRLCRGCTVPYCMETETEAVGVMNVGIESTADGFFP